MKSKLAALCTICVLLNSSVGYAGVDDANAAYDKGDYAFALQEARPFAEQGNAVAQNLLGRMYSNGLGVSRDYTQAISWFRKASEQGHVRAQVNLGIMYENGYGVPQDYAQAIMWYTKAAEQGDVSGQTNLGVMYRDGQGVPLDYVQAISWFRRAAEQGDAGAQGCLGGMYSNGYGVLQDYAQAISWYRKAAEQGNADAQTNLGYMYEKGQGVTQDYVQALAWYRKAAEQGEAMAQNNLGAFYAAGKGVAQDYAQSLVWYRKAVEQGNEKAKYFLPIVEKKLAEQQAVLQQARMDDARGYKHMSFTDFRLDAKKMRLGSKLAITGFYQVIGEIETIAESLTATRMPNAARVFLLTEDAPRETRKKLLEVRDGVCGAYGCQLTFLGHISKCEVTWLGARVKNTTCLSVEEFR